MSGVGQVAEELDGERPWAVASSRNLITCLFVRSCKRLNWRELWMGVMSEVLRGMERKFPLHSTSFSVTKA